MSWSSRARLAALVGGAVVVAYALGVLTGIMSGGAPAQDSAAPSALTTPSVVEEALRLIETTAVDAPTTGDLAAAAIAGMVRANGDVWSRYIPSADSGAFEEGIDGRYSGIGVWLGTTPSGEVTITAIGAGSPASEAGLAAHDVVMTVNGQSVSGTGTTHVADLLRGEPGSTAEVSVRRGTSLRTFTALRAQTETVSVVTTRPATGVAAFKIPAFTRGVGRDLREAIMHPVEWVDGVILDLRGNGGGLLTEAVDVASIFLEGGPVVSYTTREEGNHVLEAVGQGNTRVPVVVLVDGSTASAAEIVAAALQDRGRAVVVGSQTFGKGTVQAHYHLSDGGVLELTVARYVTAGGKTIDGIGVTPDIQVAADGVQAEARAIEVLTGLLASAGDQG